MQIKIYKFISLFVMQKSAALNIRKFLAKFFKSKRRKLY